MVEYAWPRMFFETMHKLNLQKLVLYTPPNGHLTALQSYSTEIEKGTVARKLPGINNIIKFEIKPTEM